MTQFGKRLAPAVPPAPAPPAAAGFPARFLLQDGSEHRCEVTAVDPDSALFLSTAKVREGMPLIAYIEEVGRVDGTVGDAADAGFWVNFNLSSSRQARFVRHLRWLIRRDHGLAAAERRHTRYETHNKQARYSLPGGVEQACELIDISLSGAALRARTRPSVGSPLMLGPTKARVVRHLADGFAIEFLIPLTPGDLDSALR